MTIFRLPDEPDSPAGQAIKTATAPKKIPDKNNLHVMLKSDANLGDGIFDINLDLANKLLSFKTFECEGYKWINWFLKLPLGETITLVLNNEEYLQKCILVMEDIFVMEHECTSCENNAFGFDSPNDPMVHKVKLNFKNVERVFPDIVTKKSLKKTKEEIDRDAK